MLIRNSAIYMVAKLLPGLFGLATTAALTRLLDPHEYGLYGLALVTMMLGSSILFDWLGLSFLRFYQSRRDDPNLVSTFICMFVVLVTVSAAGLGVALIGGVVRTDSGWHFCRRLAHGLGLLVVRAGFPAGSGGIPADYVSEHESRTVVVGSGRGDDCCMADDEPAVDRNGYGGRLFRGHLLRKNTDPTTIVAPVRSRSRPRCAGFRRARCGQHDAFQPDGRWDASTPRATRLSSGSRSLYRRLRSGAVHARGHGGGSSPWPAIRSWYGRWSAATTPRRGGNSWPTGRYCWPCSLPPVWAWRSSETASPRPLSARNSYPALPP